MAYRADIEIAVKGQQQLSKLQKQLNATATKINQINKKQLSISKALSPTAGSRSTRRLREAQKSLSKAVNNSNTAFRTQNELIREQIRLTNQATRSVKRFNTASKQRVNPAAAGGGRSRGGGFGGFGGGGGSTFQNVATGAGFPLLFGGGPLQALAGGIGGAVGGLGGSIAASAIVAQFEAFGRAAAQSGQAINSTGGALDFMREKSLLSTAEIEENARVLEEQGRVAELSALLTEQLVEKIGNNGVEALQGLGKETDETTRLWNELTLQLQFLVAGPLKNFLSLVNNFLGNITRAGRAEAIFKDAGAREGEARKRFDELTGRSLGTGRSGARKRQEALAAGTIISDEAALAQLRKEFPAAVKAQLPITKEDDRRFAVTPKKDRSAERAAREEERLQQRLQKLRLERDQIAEITKFKDRIAAAEADNDKLLSTRIKGEQRIFEIEQRRLQQLVGVKDQREREEINITAAAKKLSEMRNTERELAEIQRQKTELFDKTIEGLQFQLDIATATTREEAEQLRIQQEMQGLQDKGFSNEQLERIEALKQNLNQAQQPLNQFIIESTRALEDLEQVAVNVSQGIGSAIGNSLNNGITQLVEGSGSVQEVFSNMLKSIGQMLTQEGTKMIATYIAIGIARIFAGMGGGGGAETTTITTKTFNHPIGEFSSFSPLAGLANGGPAKAGQPYMVGERGPELFVPGTNGGVMRNEDLRSAMSRQQSSAPAINFNFETTNIGGQEFVSREQLEAAMATTRRQAANDGAKRGMNMTLDRMQQSPSTRRRIGIR